MARFNFLTLSSLFGAVLSLIFIFLQFQAPISMNQINTALIEDQEKKFLKMIIPF